MQKASEILKSISEEAIQDELFPVTEEDGRATISTRAGKKLQSIESVRARRDQQQQDLGFMARPFAWCNIPLRPMREKAVYERKNGDFFLRIEAGQGKELPYGRDRLVLILVATLAVQQQSRRVQLGTASDILRLFGLSTQSGTHYQRLEASFDRIFSATIYWGVKGEQNNRRFVDQHRLSMLDHMRLWFDDTHKSQGTAFENEVTLSERFYIELTKHPLPVDMEVVRCLLDSPGKLDFYIWIVLRSWAVSPGETATVSLLGPNGLKAQLGTRTKDSSKFRQQIRDWLKSTRALWPACPVELSSDGNNLIIRHGEAIRPVQVPVKKSISHAL
jgi:hypothetical protein